MIYNYELRFSLQPPLRCIGILEYKVRWQGYYHDEDTLMGTRNEFATPAEENSRIQTFKLLIYLRSFLENPYMYMDFSYKGFAIISFLTRLVVPCECTVSVYAVRGFLEGFASFLTRFFRVVVIFK